MARQTTRTIAQILHYRGIKTARDGQWQSTTVMRLLDRLGLGLSGGLCGLDVAVHRRAGLGLGGF